jgi:hypothetical protein
MAIIEIVIALLLLGVRLLESINELRKTPELNTAKKCWQVAVNFFTVEKYIPAGKI